MNINNFMQYIDQNILDRGYDYYNNGNIIDVYEDDYNKYIFEIEGSEDYEVTVEIDDDGGVIDSYCDCPYNFGPVCKHEAAAYFQLLKIINDKNNNEKAKKGSKKKQSINETLNNLSKEELIDIIIDVTKKDKTLKNNILFRYSKNDDQTETKNCKKLISSIVKKYTGRDGFVPYMETGDFVSEFEELLEKITYTENKVLALDMAILVLEEGIEAFQYADDSDGEIGSLVDDIIALINNIVIDNVNFDISVRGKLFEKLLNFSGNKIFDGWDDFEIEILDICFKFIDNKIFRDKLISKIESLIKENPNDGYRDYENESMLKILFNIIREYGTKEEEEEFINNNLEYKYFKEILINSYINKEDYNKVIELCLKAEKEDERYSGLVLQWKKIRYTAYEKLSFKEEQIKLAKELLLDNEFEYYKKLKGLVDNKEIFYNDIKKELKRNAKGMYIELIVQEKDLDAIMDFVKETPGYIETYAEILVNKFKDEVIDIYSEFIKKQASCVSDRKAYQGVCGIIKRYKKIAGEENAEKIINEFKILYKKRPAFIDELSKVK